MTVRAGDGSLLSSFRIAGLGRSSRRRTTLRISGGAIAETAYSGQQTARGTVQRRAGYSLKRALVRRPPLRRPRSDIVSKRLVMRTVVLVLHRRAPHPGIVCGEQH